MQDVRTQYQEIHDLIMCCNEAIKKLDKKAYAFLNWSPFVYDTYTQSSAFERDVFNYYQLLAECGGYIWYSSKYKDYLKTLGFDVDHIKVEFYDCLREMRLFYAHSPDSPYFYHLNQICIWLDLKDDEYNSLCDAAEETDFDTIKFNQDEKFWLNAREKLFKKTKTVLKEYATSLENIINKSELLKRYKKALVSNYQNLCDKEYLEYLIRCWLEDRIEEHFFRSRSEELVARNLLNSEEYRYKVEKLLTQDNLYKALNSSDIPDYTPYSVFEKVLYTCYRTVLFQ